MNSLVPLVLLLLLAVLFAASYSKVNNRLLIIVSVLLVTLVLCYFQMKEQFSNYAPVMHTMGRCGGYDIRGKDSVTPIGGAYGGLRLTAPGKPDYPLVSDVTIFSPVGDGIKLTEDLTAHRFPTVDGEKGKPQHLFMLAHNQSKPECCPSTFSSSLGCVCMSQKQRDYINQRGGNRTITETGEF